MEQGTKAGNHAFKGCAGNIEVLNYFSNLGDRVLFAVGNSSPWTNVYGLSRSLLAFGTLITLLFNSTEVLFRPGSGIPVYPVCSGIGNIGIFCLTSPFLEIGRWASILILIVVASGWRPRYTAVFHWWISFSLQSSALTVDGGDQVTSVLTFLLLPIALTDSRKWHWGSNADTREAKTFRENVRRVFATFSRHVIRIQVAIIYFHATVSKLSMEDWLNGTVLYYWMTDSVVGLPNYFFFLASAFTSRLVAPITWFALLVEITLFMALVMPKTFWGPVLVVGLFFHLSIALSMGLVSFGFAMFGALILYLRPYEQEFSFCRCAGWQFWRKSNEVAMTDSD